MQNNLTPPMVRQAHEVLIQALHDWDERLFINQPVDESVEDHTVHLYTPVPTEPVPQELPLVVEEPPPRIINYNPDVLTCLANLSNDEVFTPPELVNQMLDMLPAELWQNPDAKFLDPVTKSGVFLREIAKRLKPV